MKTPDQAAFKAILIVSMIIAIALLPVAAKACPDKPHGPPDFTEIDVDGDGIPELDGNGDGVVSDEPEDVQGIWDERAHTISAGSRLVWSHEDIAYMVLESAAGENELVRLVSNGEGEREVLARSVERLTFETSQPGAASVSAGTVRVRIDFRATTDSGHLFRTHSEALVRLRNNNGWPASCPRCFIPRSTSP